MRRHTMYDFYGTRMRVTLRQPANLILEGTVVLVEPSQRLVLSEVVNLTSGKRTTHCEIPASNVQDIHDASLPLDSHMPCVTPPNSKPDSAAKPPSFPQDPAILSMSRPSATYNAPPPNIGEKRDPFPTDVKRVATQIQEPRFVDGHNEHNEVMAIGAMDGSRRGGGGGGRGNRGGRSGRGPRGQRGARGGYGHGQAQGQGQGHGRSDIEGELASTQARGAGWRNTPILESTKSFQPFTSLKRGQNSRKGVPADNGWASEDPTDVQGAGDFDFEGNHAKFNKRDIFNEYRQQDETEETERLVSHNRLPRPKPGTGGGKNLHYTENVLDMISPEPKLKETPQDGWNQSEADDVTVTGGERPSGREGSGRTSRLRGESRLSTSRRSQSRKASTTHSVVGGPSRTNSGPTVTAVLSSSSSAAAAAAIAAAATATATATTTTTTTTTTAAAAAAAAATTTTTEGLYVVSSDRRIEPITHLQMLNLENIAQNEIGLTETLIAENAGRGIAEVAITALADPAIELRNAASSPPSRSTVVVLAGNNKAGSRAIAASRHLGNRRKRELNVLVCVVGLERGKELDSEVQRQIDIFRNLGGLVCSKNNLFQKHLQSSATTQVPVTLIIDALFGLSISFEELRKSEQATTYELMQWAIRNEAFKLSIDVPSGIDPATGKVNVIDEGTKIHIQPRYICAIGAPKQGLLKAIQNGRAENDDSVDGWKLFLVDICLSQTVWRKAMTNSKYRRGIDFDDKWVLEMRYQPPVDESD